MNDCRAFIFFLGARPLYRQKILSSKEIFCSPDAETNLVSASRAIQTPTGSYDAREFFSQKKITQQPDILLVKADASARNLPSNLKAFKCPRVLLVGDTHHMGMPIQKLVAYAKQEKFDRIILDHTRHHARWFFEAGLKNLHWIPAFDFTFFPRTPSPIPSRQFSFVGQAGKFHPYRCRVIESLKKSGLPMEMLRGTPAEAADIYADSVVTLNVSLNGDLNLRVFEALAAGGFLLTDKLTPSSGLELLFKPGEDIEVWSSVGELMEKARFYLDHPEDADRIRRSGQHKLLEFHHPDVKIREFFELVFEGKENPLYSLDGEASKVRASVQGADLVPGVEAYEFLQEMHRTTPPLLIWAAEGSLDEANAFFADLPRVLVNTGGGAILFLSGDEAKLDEMLGLFEGKFVIAPQSVSAHLQEWGFVEVAKGVYEFAYGALRSLKLLDAVDAAKVKTALPEILDACTQAYQALKVADKALALELPEVYQNALQRALFLDRNSLPALFQLADLCLQAGVEEDAAILLHEAHRIQPLPPEINQLREDLEQKWVSSAGILEYKQAISGGTPPTPTATYSILVVTNLFPPQEMGGYGRKIWEFSNGLIKRGNRLKILTGDAPYLQKAPDAGEPDLEPLVERTLVLQGEWKNGKTQHLGDLTFFRRTAQANKEKVLAAVTSFKPDFVLLGNFDFLGVDILKALLAIKMPVLHSLGNQTPGYQPQESIESPLYTIAPASDWLGENLLEQGYKVSKLSTVYPGARVDRFFKQFLPDIRRLRIAFAGLVMTYKGAHVLMDALSILNQSGIEFEADFAGDSTDKAYIRALKEFAQNNGMAAKVRFNGFLDREGLAALFARCNVLVFPTQVPEAFGISQVEAMASGLIVITSGTGGTQEVIRHGIDGLVFEMGSAVSLAQNLATLATNKELRDKLQINSQKRALQFSVTESVVRIEKIAGEILGADSLSGFAHKETSLTAPAGNPHSAATSGIDCVVAKTAISPVPKNDKIGVYLYSHEAEIGAPTFPAIRQTYFSQGVVGEFKFSEKLTEDATFIVTFGGPSIPEVAKKFPKEKRICVLMENPRIWMPPPQYIAEMGTVVCPFPIPVPKGTKLIISQAAVPWFYGIKFRTDVGLLHAPAPEGNLELQDLAEMTKHPKDKLISCIASQKAGTPGHQWRLQVAQALQKHFGQNIDLFGFGWNPIAEKRDAIDRYHYTVVIENDESDHYWTEKLSDAILGYSVPIYAGARKVNEYFDGGIHCFTHGLNLEETVKIIKSTINNEPDINQIYCNRHKILFKHNFFYMIANLLDKLNI
jgi:glycosyltransferase involved in cell wall biosynthesis